MNSCMYKRQHVVILEVMCRSAFFGNLDLLVVLNNIILVVFGLTKEVVLQKRWSFTRGVSQKRDCACISVIRQTDEKTVIHSHLESLEML